MANAMIKFMQKTMLCPVSDSKLGKALFNEIVRENKMIHLRMSATEGWVSVTDALVYLWHKIYSSNPPEIDWSKRLPRSIYIKAYWPPAVKDREEFVSIHLDNLHILFNDPTYMVDDAIINEAISDFRSKVADPKSVKDDTYMIIVGDAKKTASQVRWQRDIREKLTQPDEYYRKKHARDDRHRVHRKKRKSGLKTRKGDAQPAQITCIPRMVVVLTAHPCTGI